MASHAPKSSQVRTSDNYLWNRLDVLGQGATCEVYKAYHKTSGEPAAVKVFNKSGMARDLYQQKRELQLVRKLEHKNLVKVLAIEVEDDPTLSKSVVVMELCEGRSLFGFLSLPANRYGLVDKELLVVLNDVTEGIKYLRENNVVHRDIKPGNIMRCIKEDGSSVYKLTDFGGARELESEACFQSLHGTEEYLHPDIYEKALVDKKAPANFKAEVDLWSLGATFYHCAAGQTPFRPFQGRSDKITMLEMTKSKDPGVISGIQTKDGSITYSKEIPAKSPLSKALKRIIEPILGKLLEHDDERAMNFEQYFDNIKRLTNMKKFQLLNISDCATHSVYVEPSCTFQNFLIRVEEITGIEPCHQIVLTQRYINRELLEKDFQRFNELYVLDKSEQDIVTNYSATLTNSRFSKASSDLITYDYSLSYAISIEAYQYSLELERCSAHSKLVAHAIQSLVDFCEDSPNRLEINLSDLTAKSLNLESRRKDIILTNEAFIKILDLLMGIFMKVDPNTITSICKLSSKTLQQFQSILTSELIGRICNKLQQPCSLDFNRFIHQIEVVELAHVIQVLTEIADPGIEEFLKNCLAVEVPITYIVSLLEITKSNLSMWAKQKISSGSSIDEQLHTLHSKIRDIQANNTHVDATVTAVTTQMEDLSNIMSNLLVNIAKIHELFEKDKKQKATIRVTQTVQIMHQLNRSYLDTLKKRAFDVATEAVESCTKINKCLKPRIREFFTLQDTLRKYRLEYHQDLAMLSEYENNLEQWKSHMFGSVSEIAQHISVITLPTVESSQVRREVLDRLGDLEGTNKRNWKLCQENSQMLLEVLKLFDIKHR